MKLLKVLLVAAVLVWVMTLGGCDIGDPGPTTSTPTVTVIAVPSLTHTPTATPDGYPVATSTPEPYE